MRGGIGGVGEMIRRCAGFVSLVAMREPFRRGIDGTPRHEAGKCTLTPFFRFFRPRFDRLALMRDLRKLLKKPEVWEQENGL